MNDAKQIADMYIAVWNETDHEKRMALLAAAWTRDARYVDPLMEGEGHEQISGLIGAVHERFPGFRFALEGVADGYGDKVRFSWIFGPQTEPDMIKGTDFAVVDNDRLTSVTGFLDKVPAER